MASAFRATIRPVSWGGGTFAHPRVKTSGTHVAVRRQEVRCLQLHKLATARRCSNEMSTPTPVSGMRRLCQLSDHERRRNHVSIAPYCGAQMDRNGRFDFWPMLLYTRTITPPRVTRSLWSQMPKRFAPGWLVLLTIVALSIGAALYTRHLPSHSGAVGLPAATTSSGPPKPSPPW